MKLRGILFALTAGAALSLGAAAAAYSETIKVGILNQDTGPFAVQGEDFRHGIEAYVALHGKQIGGDTVEIVYRDIGGPNPAQARRLAEELIVREGVSILGGFYLSSDALAAADVINQADVPAVLFVAASPSILQQSKSFIRAGQHIGQSAMIAAKYALKEGKRNAYIAVADYAPGHDVQKVFRETFEAGGGKIAGEDRVPLNTIDFASVAERIANANPDVVEVFVPPGAPAVGLAKALSSTGLMNKAMVIGMGEAEDGDLKLFDDSLIGFYQALYYAEGVQNAENEALKVAFKEKYGRDARTSFAAVSAYDGMAVIYKMIEAQKGGHFDAGTALKGVEGYSWNSPRGPMTIDPETREVVQNIYIRKVVKEDGKLKNVVVDTFKNVRAPDMAN
jgi:branched-chain amino acid transport system substrate-binding protein